MKSRILLPFAMFNIVLSILSGALIYLTQDNMLWFGAMIAAASGPLYLMLVVGSGRVARTSAKLPLMQLISAAGLFMALYAFIGMPVRSTTAFFALVVSVLGVVYVQWYVHIYSSYNRKKSQSIIKGHALPELPLEQLDGTSTTSASFVGKKTLIVFFRANWCPLCMAQLKEIVDRASQLSALGVQVRFVSNQSVEHSTELAQKLDLPSDFQILFDRDLRAAKRLEIQDEGGTPMGMVGYPRDTVMATVIALDEEGRVIFGDESDNYRVRPHPDTFMDVFER